LRRFERKGDLEIDRAAAIVIRWFVGPMLMVVGCGSVVYGIVVMAT
jgi:hypothetical protein